MHRTLKLSALLIVLLFIILAAGCGQNKDKAAGTHADDEVTIGFSSEPENWDPCTGYGSTGPIIFSTLMEVKGNNELVGDLALDHEVSADALTWTFNIRDDVYFTDGEKLTARDVAFTYLTTKNSRTYVDLTMLDSVSAPDDTTVVFKLKKPTSTFIITTAEIGIVPEHAYDANFGQQPVGSGPYQLVQWDKGQQFILAANDNYYGVKPAIKKAIFLIISDEDARFAAARSGQVDLALTSAVIAVNEIPGMRLLRVQSVDNRGMTLPLTPNRGQVTEEGYPMGNDVTSDMAIRKALCYGIDREQIIREALNGFASPAYTECDGLDWWNPDTVIETDLEKAREILTAAGWVDSDGDGIREKNGLKASFNCIYFAGDSMRQALALSTANQAKRNLGIEITVEGVSSDEAAQRMFAEAMILAWGSANPMTSYLLFHSSNAGQADFYNPEYFADPTVDGYLDAAMNSASLQESIPYWQKAQWDGSVGTSMLGSAPWLFLVNMEHLYFAKENLDIGQQKIHAHGAAWPLVANLKEWRWKDNQ